MRSALDELNGHVALVDPGRRKRQHAELANLQRRRRIGDEHVDPEHLDVEAARAHHARFAGRSSGARRCECSL